MITNGLPEAKLWADALTDPHKPNFPPQPAHGYFATSYPAFKLITYLRVSKQRLRAHFD